MVKKLTMVMISAALLLGLSSCAGITRSMLYFPGNDTRVPDLSGSGLVEIESGRTVSRGVFVPGGEDLVVLFHGNGGTFYAQQEPARRWREAGFSVLIVEYPGYGISADSRLSESAIYRDAEALIRHVMAQQGFASGQIVLCGHSLGTGVAVEMAGRGLGRSLVLFTPYTSIEDIGAQSLPRWLVRLVLTDRFDNASKAPGIQLPALVIHGVRDEVVPFVFGEEISRIFPRGELMRLDSGEHSFIYEVLNDAQWQAIVEFARSAR
jgi:pimeloyl-ACP methyl ester carboxylesterase